MGIMSDGSGYRIRYREHDAVWECLEIILGVLLWQRLNLRWEVLLRRALYADIGTMEAVSWEHISSKPSQEHGGHLKHKVHHVMTLSLCRPSGPSPGHSPIGAGGFFVTKLGI